MAQKMDQNSLIGFLLIGAILVGWSYWMQPSDAQIEAEKVRQDSIAQVEQAAQQKAEAETKSAQEISNTKTAVQDTLPVNDSIIDRALTDSYGRFSNSAVGSEQFYIIENEKLEITLSNKGGRLVSARLKEYETYDKNELVLFDKDSSDFAMLFNSQNRLLYASDFYFQTQASGLEVDGEGEGSFSLKLLSNNPSQYIEYVYTLKGNTYDLDFKVNLVGLQDLAQENGNKLNLHWQMKSPAKEKGFETENRRTTIFYKPVEDNDDYISEASPERYDMEEDIEWISFKQQFFSVALLPEQPFLADGSYLETMASNENSKYIKNMVSHVAVPINNGQAGFKIFMGPNDFYLLQEYGIENQIDLGWGIFGWVSEWFLIPIFTFLSMADISYGIIILLLTLGIKLILSPITYKSYLSGAKMKVLRPEIEEINEKFKDADPMKKQQEVMALYNKAGVNPMSGCIPMLLQMPILYAMFMLFPATIQLRGESFLWAEDLSTYDSVFQLPFTIPFYGDHVSLFTLMMALSMFLYTKSNISSGTMGAGGGNEAQMKQMQIMMLYFMPVMMLIWFNNYPAGLSYYYLCANVTSIIQNWAFRKYLVNEEEIHAKVQENKKKPKKKSRFAAKMEELAKQQEAKANRTQRRKK